MPAKTTLSELHGAGSPDENSFWLSVPLPVIHLLNYFHAFCISTTIVNMYVMIGKYIIPIHIPNSDQSTASLRAVEMSINFFLALEFHSDYHSWALL